MNALSAILTLSAQVSNALERTARPNLKDVKEARDASKKCTKISDATVALLEEGIYEVCEAPAEDTPLFKGTEPAPGVNVEEPAPPVPMPVAPLQTLGFDPANAIDVEVLPTHPLDMVTASDVTGQDALFDALLNRLENAGIEEGLKLKGWAKAKAKWDAAWNDATAEKEEVQAMKKVYDLAVFALETRQPISWAIPTEKEINDHARMLAIASGE